MDCSELEQQILDRIVTNDGRRYKVTHISIEPYDLVVLFVEALDETAQVGLLINFTEMLQTQPGDYRQLLKISGWEFEE